MLILFFEFYLRKKFVAHLFTVVFKVLGKQFCFVPTMSLAQCVFGLVADVYTSPQQKTKISNSMANTSSIIFREKLSERQWGLDQSFRLRDLTKELHVYQNASGVQEIDMTLCSLKDHQRNHKHRLYLKSQTIIVGNRNNLPIEARDNCLFLSSSDSWDFFFKTRLAIMTFIMEIEFT